VGTTPGRDGRRSENLQCGGLREARQCPGSLRAALLASLEDFAGGQAQQKDLYGPEMPRDPGKTRLVRGTLQRTRPETPHGVSLVQVPPLRPSAVFRVRLGKSMKPDSRVAWTPELLRMALNHIPESARIGLRLSLPFSLDEHAREFFSGQDAILAAMEARR
jgi:hypothetical protein